ncbi:MAG: ATP-binding protein [Bacteroidia bacterium]|nr:ATP-binding protein [Bacteroidia bacterium]
MRRRLLFHTIVKQLQHKNALVITGMRQVGKTTLMKQLYDEWTGPKLWFDFDNPLDMMVFENPDYRAIFENLRIKAGVSVNERLLVCIDEIQNMPEITRIIKFLIDHSGVKFILTGSSNFYLRNLFPESLSGRKFLYHLPVLSYKEYLYFNDKLDSEAIEPQTEALVAAKMGAEAYRNRELFDSYLKYGGFPEVAMTPDPETKLLVIRNIFSSFFEKDVRVFDEFREVRELRNLILLLAPRNGGLIDVSRLSAELGVNRVKIYSYLELLEGTFFLKLLPRFTGSIDRQVAGGKKVYFTDTGLLNLAGNVTDGQLLEVAVHNALMSYGQLSFYNKRNTAELDFILNGETGFEVKQTATPHDLVRVRKLGSALGLKQTRLISGNITDLEDVIYPWHL